MLDLLHHDYNAAGQRHADRYVRLRPGPVPLRFADFTPTGFFVTRGLTLTEGPIGTVRLDHHEILRTPEGELCFHRGGYGYLDAANVKYGHIALQDLRDDPGPPVPSRGHRGAPAPLAHPRDRRRVRVRSIPPQMHYKRPFDTRSGSNRGARFLHYGDPAADQGDQHAFHYTYLLWSFPNVRGGGMVRTLLREGDLVEVCDVHRVDAPSYDETGAINGVVQALYVRAELDGNALYGWTVSTRQLSDDRAELVHHLEAA